MSHYPYGRGLSSLSSSFNERAGPRNPDGQKYHHPVSELYPMQAHSDSPIDFRYRPTADIMMPGSGHASHASSHSGSVAIPVVHLGSSSATPSPGYYGSRTPTSPSPASGVVGGSRGSLISRKTPTNLPDPEAEVDALTTVLMQRMETPRSGGLMSPIETSTGGTSSPVGGVLRRGSGGSLPGGVASSASSSSNSRLSRIQQQATQQRVGSPHGGLSNNGGSPLTIGSPRTSSPTNSSTSSTGGPPGGSGSASDQGSCFRCRRALVPPESATLGGGSTPTPPVVTLTGALAVRLHEACFTCYMCRTKLNPQAYYHSLRRLLCPTCVRDGAVESCAKCSRPIGERIVRALGAPYHPGCFICSVCQTHLDSKPFTVDVHGRPLCLDDFHRRYAPRCAICNRPIAPEAGSQEARRVVAANMNYHLSCYGVKAAANSASSTPTPSLAAV